MPTNKFKLDDYHLHISEEIVDAAYLVFHRGEVVLRRFEESQHVWVFNFTTTPNLEAEVAVGRKWVKSYSCDCHEYQRGIICQHIAASLLYILDSRDRKRAKAENGHLPKTLQVRKILEAVPEKDLREFIRHYARQDAIFSLSFKSKFAHLVELADNETKYLRLCKRFRSSLGAGKLSKNKQKILVHFIQDLLDLSDDLFVDHDYQEIFHLLYGVHKFLIYLSSFSTFDYHSLEKTACDKLVRLLAAEMAPSLRNKIQEVFQALVLEQEYKIHDELNLYAVLIDHSLNETVRKLMFDHLKDYISTHVDHEIGLSTWVKKSAQHGKTHEIPTMLAQYKHDYLALKNSLQWLHSIPAHHDVLRESAHLIYQVAEGRRLKDLCFEMMMEVVSEKSGIELCIQHYLADRRLSTLQKITGYLGDHMGLALQMISEQLKAEKDYFHLTNILARQQRFDELIQILESRMDRRLLLANLPYLYDTKYDQIENIFLEIHRNYLSVHVGQQSVEKITDTLDYLIKRQMPKLIRALQHMIITEFSERTFLTRSLKKQI